MTRDVMKLYIILILLILGLNGSGVGRSIDLKWEPVDDMILTYRVYWGTATGVYDRSMDVGNNHQVTIFDLADSVRYFFAVTAIDFWGNESPYSKEVMSSGVPLEETLPKKLVLEENYPNPFNSGTTLDYSLPEDQVVTLEVYNSLGQKVKTLKQEAVPAGNYSVQWDARDDNGAPMPSGTYFVVLYVKEIRLVRQMMLIR